ncbi:MAG: hypothetical protein LUD27_05685 [Clostridia bacterium]|nr:hypothetical protein [Clostridia bacterium]
MSSTKNPVIQSDIMRYRPNKFSSNFTLLSIAFGCLYFLVLYGQYTRSYELNVEVVFFDVGMGLSVIYNLVFLLLTFYMSIQIKNYRKSASYVLIGLAVIQVLRIFWYPVRGLSKDLISAGDFTVMIIWLALSAACLIVAAVFGIIRNKQYYDYRAKLESGEIDIDAVLKQADAEEEASVANAAAKEV